MGKLSYSHFLREQSKEVKGRCCRVQQRCEASHEASWETGSRSPKAPFIAHFKYLAKIYNQTKQVTGFLLAVARIITWRSLWAALLCKCLLHSSLILLD